MKTTLIFERDNKCEVEMSLVSSEIVYLKSIALHLPWEINDFRVDFLWNNLWMQVSVIFAWDSNTWKIDETQNRKNV